jgi:MFS family permease
MALLGIGWLGIQFFWGFYSATMPLFLNGFTDSKFMISLALSVAGVSGCTVPPIAGYLSDRTVTRFGRRRPYVLIGMLGSFFCLFALPHVAVFWVVVFVSALMYFAVDLAMTPYWSLVPDIVPPEQRSAASGVMSLFGSLGLTVFFYLSSRLWEAHPNGVFYLVAAVSLGAVLAALFFLREPMGPYDPPPKRAGALKYLRSVTGETNALMYFSAQFFWWLGFWLVQPFLTLFAVEALGASEGDAHYVPMAASIGMMVFALPTGMLGDRMDRKKLLSAIIVLWAVAEVLLGLSQSLTHALVVAVMLGIPLAAAMGPAYAYMLDLIPAERTAEFVGFHIISMAAPQIFGPLIGGKMIDAFGYRPLFPVAAAMTLAGFILLQFTRKRRSTID